MNKKENVERGEFFKITSTVIRRNGKFYISSKEGGTGFGMKNILVDTNQSLYSIKSQLLSNLKICFESFEQTVFEERSKEQLKKITKKTCYEEHLLTDNDWAESNTIRKKADMEEMLEEVNLIKMELR